MGRQVQFYTLDEDLKLFLEYAATTGTVVLIRGQNYSSFRPDEVLLTDFPSVTIAQEPQHFYLWNKLIPEIPFTQRIVPYDKSKPAFFSLDARNSSVIELRRCILKQSVLTEGRIWMEPAVLEDKQTLKHKSDEFIEWYEKLQKWIKKNFFKVSDRWGNNVFIGSSALRWSKEGGSLENVEPENLVSNKTRSAK